MRQPHGEPGSHSSHIIRRFSLSGSSPWAGLIIILIVYAGLSLYQINLPGLHYDEAFEAVPALQLLLGQPTTAFRGSGVMLGGQLFPLMTQDYIGAINTYLAIPFIAIFGATPAALRVMSIVVGAITIWLTYLLSYWLTGEHRVGLVAALLLAVDPTFIFWNRQGIFVTAVTATIGLAAAVSWLRRWQTGTIGWSVAGAFFFGLGLYAKFLFIWLIAALIGAVVLLNLARFRSLTTAVLNLLRHGQVEIALVGLAFIAGCWPLLLYNLQTGGTWLNISQNALTSYYGVNNLAFGSNLLERMHQFGTLLSSSQLWYLGRIIANPLPLIIFGSVLSGVVLAAIFATQKDIAVSNNWPTSSRLPRPQPVKVGLFPFVVIGLTVFFSIGTVSALWLTHFAILAPWPALAITLGGWYIYHTLRLGNGAPVKLSALAWLGLALLVATNLLTVARYHQALTESGGLSSHSDAIYDLSEWLAQHATGEVVAMDWGLAAPVTYLTHGQVTPTEIFGYSWDANTDLTIQLEKFIVQPDSLYLWRAPTEIIFDRSQEFKALYRPRLLVEHIEAAFYERSGRPILGVTRLVACGTPDIILPEPPDHCP